MNMGRYLEKTLGGETGKLVCQCCGRLIAILARVDDKYICDLCKKRMEEERDE